MTPTAQTPPLINAHRLFHAGCDCACECCDDVDMLYRIRKGDTAFVSDRFVIIREDLLDGLSGDWAIVHDLDTIPEADWFDLTVTPAEEPSTRVFQKRFLDPLHDAGLRVRPIGHPHTHAIVAPDRRVMGFIMPLVEEPGDSGYADDEVGVAS